MSDNAIVEARHASINTATVSIRALQVSGKQMTLSVFKQLPERWLLDTKDGTLRGVPWGWVNYYWNRCHESMYGYGYATQDNHLHVIWTNGYYLYRACVYMPFYGASEEYRDAYQLIVDAGQLFIAT